MELLGDSVKAYIRHHFWDGWGYWQRRLAQDKLSLYELLIHTDFSSVMKFDNKFTATCDHPSSGVVLVATVQHSPEVRVPMASHRCWLDSVLTLTDDDL